MVRRFRRQHVQAVLLSEFEHFEQRLARQHLSGRILRRVQHQQPRSAGQLLLKIGNRKLAIVQDVNRHDTACRRPVSRTVRNEARPVRESAPQRWFENTKHGDGDRFTGPP